MIYRQSAIKHGLMSVLPRGEGWIYHGDPQLPRITHPPDERCEECDGASGRSQSRRDAE